jgi:hypothetical protein
MKARNFDVDPESGDVAPRTSYIWETLAVENERQARLRAKLSSSTFNSSGTDMRSVPQFGTPDTAADSPASSNTGSNGGRNLSASIDETLVRLDDILSRTFQFSRSRNAEISNADRSTLEDECLVAVSAVGCLTESAGVDEDDDDEASDHSDFASAAAARILIPLGDSPYPESPLRQERTTKAADTSGFSYASCALEDEMNESAVRALDASLEKSSFFHSHSYSEEPLLMNMSMPASILNNTTSDDDAADDGSVEDDSILRFHEVEQFIENNDAARENEISVCLSSGGKPDIIVNGEVSPTGTASSSSSSSTDDDNVQYHTWAEKLGGGKDDQIEFPPHDISAETTLPHPVDLSEEAEQTLLGERDVGEHYYGDDRSDDDDEEKESNYERQVRKTIVTNNGSSTMDDSHHQSSPSSSRDEECEQSSSDDEGNDDDHHSYFSVESSHSLV